MLPRLLQVKRGISMNDFAKRYFSVWFKMIAIIIGGVVIGGVFGGLAIVAHFMLGPFGVLAYIMLIITSAAALLIALNSDENDPI